MVEVTFVPGESITFELNGDGATLSDALRAVGREVGDFQYRVNGEDVDPENYIPVHGDSVLAGAKPAGA